jgi:hypothetical protein
MFNFFLNLNFFFNYLLSSKGGPPLLIGYGKRYVQKMITGMNRKVKYEQQPPGTRIFIRIKNSDARVVTQYDSKISIIKSAFISTLLMRRRMFRFFFLISVNAGILIKNILILNDGITDAADAH